MVSLNASPNCGTEKQLANPQITKKQTPICMYIHITFGRPNSYLHHNWKESSIEKHFSFSAFSRVTKRAVLQQQRQHT